MKKILFFIFLIIVAFSAQSFAVDQAIYYLDGTTVTTSTAIPDTDGVYLGYKKLENTYDQIRVNVVADSLSDSAYVFIEEERYKGSNDWIKVYVDQLTSEYDNVTYTCTGMPESIRVYIYDPTSGDIFHVKILGVDTK